MATNRNNPSIMMDCSGKPSVELAPFGRMELCAPDKFPKRIKRR
ncbi:MAG: hypothetical protein QW124_06695 [Thermoplasmata archaeon]